MPMNTRRAVKEAPRRPAILLPVDGSPASRRAIACAATYARKLRAEIVGVHVVTPYELAIYSRARPAIVTPDQFKKLATRISERILSAVSNAAAAAKVPCRCLTMWNAAVADAILLTARVQRCELIVMASHGRTGLQRILLGSITQKVLAGSRVPVMVLPGLRRGIRSL
jgi:nucleotide-binding universal stress UspA family protein